MDNVSAVHDECVADHVGGVRGAGLPAGRGGFLEFRFGAVRRQVDRGPFRGESQGATARPIPRDAPVIRATFPFNLPITCYSSYRFTIAGVPRII